MLIFWARGPWGPLGPRCRIRVESVTTYCQAGFQPYQTCTQTPHTCTQTLPHTDYLLSGKATYCQAKLHTVRQATYCQASYLLSGRLSAVSEMHPKGIYFAPKSLHRLAPNKDFAPNRSIYMHPKGAYMHPKVAAYIHPII